MAVATRLIFEAPVIAASGLMTAEWARLKDTAVIEVVIEGVSYATPDQLLELYLSCFGEIKQLKAKKVMWDKMREEDGSLKATGTRRVWMTLKTGTTLPVKNLLAGDIFTMKHDGQHECYTCHMPKEYCSLGSRACKKEQNWKVALEQVLREVGLD